LRAGGCIAGFEPVSVGGQGFNAADNFELFIERRAAELNIVENRKVDILLSSSRRKCFKPIADDINGPLDELG
jgi:hypothetical protein